MSEGERKEEADFHKVVAWNKLAELCSQLLKKGNRVFVSGRLQNRSWEGQDGQQRQVTEIVIEDMLLLTSKNSYDSDYSSSQSTPADRVPARSADEMPAKKSPDPESVVSQPPEQPKEEKPAREEVEDLDDLPF